MVKTPRVNVFRPCGFAFFDWLEWDFIWKAEGVIKPTYKSKS